MGVSTVTDYSGRSRFGPTFAGLCYWRSACLIGSAGRCASAPWFQRCLPGSVIFKRGWWASAGLRKRHLSATARSEDQVIATPSTLRSPCRETGRAPFVSSLVVPIVFRPGAGFVFYRRRDFWKNRKPSGLQEPLGFKTYPREGTGKIVYGACSRWMWIRIISASPSILFSAYHPIRIPW